MARLVYQSVVLLFESFWKAHTSIFLVLVRLWEDISKDFVLHIHFSHQDCTVVAEGWGGKFHSMATARIEIYSALELYWRSIQSSRHGWLLQS